MLTIDRNPSRVPIIPVVDHNDLRAWMARMGYTYDVAAYKLGVNRTSLAVMLKGESRATLKPLPLSRSIQLAAMAIEQGLDVVLPPPQVRTKGKPRQPDPVGAEVESGAGND